MIRTLRPGELFDNQYRLIQLIDTGGFADVWKANHLAAKDHIVALKVYPMLDAEGVNNIENEYDNQKDLSHTHLLTAKHFGKDADGDPYLVMRYCSGGNGSYLIGKCNEKAIANIMYQVGSALAYLHEEDIVHQDIKPNNILFDERDGREYVYLADLGLSLKVRNTIRKFTESSRSNSNSIQAGLTPPPYRAFELWGKDSINREPIKATDIWAFGASLFELVSGDVPFGEFGGINQKSDPDPPNLPVDFQRECASDDLNHILKKCLSINTWDRPKAQELALWGNNFLTTGKWGIDKTAPSSGPSPSRGSDTFLDSGFPNSTRPPVDSKRNSFKNVIKWAAIIGLGFTAAFGVHMYVDGKNSEASQAELTPKTLVGNPSNTVKAANEVEPAETRANPGISGNNRRVAVERMAPPAIETGIINNPVVDKYPTHSDIRITRIKRTANSLVVNFLLKRGEMPETAEYTIYGPESPLYTFYVKEGSKIYALIGLQNGTNGERIQWGNKQSHAFTATFAPIPDNIMTVDIKEAIERDGQQSYWNFKGVHLPRPQHSSH